MRTDDTEVAVRVIGDRIRARRLYLRLRQHEVRGPYTSAYISALERGLAAPSLAALLHLSRALKVSPDYWLRGL